LRLDCSGSDDTLDEGHLRLRDRGRTLPSRRPFTLPDPPYFMRPSTDILQDSMPTLAPVWSRSWGRSPVCERHLLLEGSGDFSRRNWLGSIMRKLRLAIALPIIQVLIASILLLWSDRTPVSPPNFAPAWLICTLAAFLWFGLGIAAMRSANVPGKFDGKTPDRSNGLRQLRWTVGPLGERSLFRELVRTVNTYYRQPSERSESALCMIASHTSSGIWQPFTSSSPARILSTRSVQ
jgi:hypothetical protein